MMEIPVNYAIVERVEFARSSNDVVVARLATAGGVAEVALYGAQLVRLSCK